MIIAVSCWTTFKDLSPLFCIINFPASTKSESFMLCYFYCHCSFSIAPISFLKYKVIMYFLFLCFPWSPPFSIMAELKSFSTDFPFSLQLSNHHETPRLCLQTAHLGLRVWNGPFSQHTPRSIKTPARRNVSGELPCLKPERSYVNFAPWTCYQSQTASLTDSYGPVLRERSFTSLLPCSSTQTMSD